MQRRPYRDSRGNPAYPPCQTRTNWNIFTRIARIHLVPF